MTALKKEQGAALLKWMRGDALEKERELREAGWTEDARGLWSLGKNQDLHLYDAHELASEDESWQEGSEGTR